MSVLQDNCPFKDFDTVKEIIEADYGGKRLEDVFATFDPNPL